MDRFTGMVTAFDEQLDNYDTIKEAALTPVAWTMTIGGLVIALPALWALFARPAKAAESAERSKQPDMSGPTT